MSSEKRPKVGIGVIVRKGDYVLFGQRKNAHGHETWSLPGGHLEYHESWEECALREVEEETGLAVRNIRHVATTNDIFHDDDKHYITIFVVADWVDGEPEVLEPHKCMQWKWVTKAELPEPLFIPVKNFLNDGHDLFV